MNEFCVYLTIYYGDKMPKYYLGSSSVKRILNGYHGSVRSKRYMQIWKQELKNSPQLFHTTIIELCKTRELALERELFLQYQYNVCEDKNFLNLSFACKNGCFGLSNDKHPNFGTTKENNLSIKKACKTKEGRNKENHEGVKIQSIKLSKTQTGLSKENNEGYFKRAMSLRKIPNEIRLEIVKKRQQNETFISIFKWVISEGYNVTYGIIPKIYYSEIKNENQ